MAIIKKNEVMPELPVIILLYGVPGAGKTSIATTAENPLVIDTDRGSQRAVQRVDTLFANRWEEINETLEDGSLASYKTIILDTAKGALDDFIQAFAERSDERLKKNTLKRFGMMADVFKNFVNHIRENGTDIVFICHDKEEMDGDIIKHSPDCTGQSKQLLMRIADEIGFVGYNEKRQRIVCFEPRYNYVSKDVAALGSVEVPDANSPEFKDFLASIISRIKSSIANKSETQRKAIEKLDGLRDKLMDADSEEAIKTIMAEVKNLPKIMQKPFFKEMTETLALSGWNWDATTKSFSKTA